MISWPSSTDHEPSHKHPTSRLRQRLCAWRAVNDEVGGVGLVVSRNHVLAPAFCATKRAGCINVGFVAGLFMYILWDECGTDMHFVVYVEQVGFMSIR
jgi:hypothetical protein